MKISNLSISFGENVIYKDFCMDIVEGQTLCIMGSSGSGKTTLLKAMAGLINFDGEVSGIDKVGYVFQNNALIPTISCERNCLFVMNDDFIPKYTIDSSNQGEVNLDNKAKTLKKDKFSNKENSNKKCCKCDIDRSKDKETFSKGLFSNCKLMLKMQNNKDLRNLKRQYVADIFKRLSISDCLKKMPTQISGGEASRVSMARALCCNAKVLLLDEPFRGLDIANKYLVLELFMKIVKEQNKTVIFVSHDIEDCLRFGDRVVVIKRMKENGIQIYGDFELKKVDADLIFLQEVREKIINLLTNK